MPRILIIDDAKLVRDILRQFLVKAGHEVIEAEDGVRGAEIYIQSAPDLVICDLVMPNKDGLETLRELRRVDPAAKVIMISGGVPENNAENIQQARELGAIAFLPKPFARAKLLEAVAIALQQHGVT
jgi:two-component system, chemotaxis family, chemotaxis protein CheY